MTCGWTGVCHPVLRELPISYYQNLPSCPLLRWILVQNAAGLFDNFTQTHSYFKENVPKKEPLLENFEPQNPPIQTAYIRTFNMLCIPSPLFLWSLYGMERRVFFGNSWHTSSKFYDSLFLYQAYYV